MGRCGVMPAMRRARIIVLGNEIPVGDKARVVPVDWKSEDYVLWTYREDDSMEVQRITFEVACEQLWQTVRRGIPPRSLN